MSTTLIIGYGNPDRQDDGLAWHILVKLAESLGRPLPEGPEEGFLPAGLNPDLWFDMQLMPEMAEDIAGYDRVCFIDAHTGDIPQDVFFREVEQSAAASVFTHHFLPAACIAMVNSLYKKQPEAKLLSIRGTRFGFSRELTPEAQELAEKALVILKDWLHS